MTINGLANEKSPYLIQHAHNPVNWQPWSEAAFTAAREKNKPIFLSIGYATCHWCHVMEKESFENEEVARHLNDTFVCIKVDREERPDIDAVYMAACQMLTGSGGWPLSIFMTPDKKPFYAATYLPARSRFGRPGLIDICLQVKEKWQREKDTLESAAAEIMMHLDRAFEYDSARMPGEELLDQAYRQIQQRFDPQYGGFESAPKFPSPHRLQFLLRMHDRTGDEHALEMVVKTLTAMRLGGIWDHVGLGFHRYATDARWLLPHFEKMLYDQAQLATAYLEAFQATGEPLFSRTAREIFEYVLRDMTDPAGGFYSAEDADSEGEEGKFYVWTQVAFEKTLTGLDAGLWENILSLRSDGNFLDEATKQRTGANILNLSKPLSAWSEELGLKESEMENKWQAVRERLFSIRDARVHPLKDDKILTGWNGLMIGALAMGARVLGEKTYAEVAAKAATFILEKMRGPDGRLYHRFRDGEVAIPATAEDYAYFIHALLRLYQATFDLAWAETARDLQKEMISDYWDGKSGGFFTTARTRKDLPVRPKELFDGAAPSANSVSLENLLFLHRLTGDVQWEERAYGLVRAFSGTVDANPGAFTYFLCGIDMAFRKGDDVVVTGTREILENENILTELTRNYVSNQMTLIKTDANADRLSRFAGFTESLDVLPGKAQAHICRGGACTGTASKLGDLLNPSKKSRADHEG